MTAPAGKLRGDRISLRPLEVADAETCLRWINDPAVTAGILADRWMMNLEQEREWLRTATQGRDFHFAIVEKSTGHHIGNCGLFDIDRVDSCAKFGIFIGEADARGKGFGSEAVRLAVGFAFFVQNLNRVELGVFAGNEKAMRTYEKVGFVREGTARRRRFKDGVYVDEIQMGLLRDEFRRA